MVVAGSPRFGTGNGDIDTTAQITFFTAEAQSSTNRGAEMIFKVTPTTRTGMEDWLKVNATALTNLNIAYDPNGSFQQTVLSTQSTNGFQIDDTVKMNNAIFKVANLSSDPTTGNEAGNIYFNTTDNKFRGYNGTAWVDLS